MADQNFSMKSGDSKVLAIAIANSAGTPVDVSTAAAISWKLAATPYGTALLTKTLGSGITVSTSTVSVTLTAANTQDLEGVYYQEMQITDASGNVSTVLSGQIAIGRDLI